jgi:hypothetical protein
LTTTGVLAAQAHHLGIRHPEGSDDDRFVTGVQGGQQRVEQDLLGTRRCDHFGRLVSEPVVARELGYDGRLQRRRAADGRPEGLDAGCDGSVGQFRAGR